MKLLTFLTLLLSLPVIAQDIESFSWKEARLNDKIELTLTQELFEKKYKADSLATPLVGECCSDDESIKMVYYKGAKFEMNKGMLHFRSIDFTKKKGMYFSIDNDWFDHTTTLKSFMKTYPNASEYIEDSITDDGDIHDMIALLSKDEDDYEWRFYFNDGKLHSIECWQYCD